MPEWLSFDTDTIEKTEAYQFEDPWDPRRYFSAGDNQIAGVGDGFTRNSPAWVETVKGLHPDIPVYGSVCEANEYMQRIIGPENLLLWVGLYPDEMGRFIERANAFALEILKAQIKALIHGTMARKPTQPMRFTASASGCLRAIAILPGSPRTRRAAPPHAAPTMKRDANVR